MATDTRPSASVFLRAAVGVDDVDADVDVDADADVDFDCDAVVEKRSYRSRYLASLIGTKLCDRSSVGCRKVCYRSQLG